MSVHVHEFNVFIHTSDDTSSWHASIPSVFLALSADLGNAVAGMYDFEGGLPIIFLAF